MKYLKKGFTFCFLIILMIFPVLSINSSAQLDFEDNMVPNYSESIEVAVHSIIINQTAPHKLLVEELITFKNTGNENYTGKLYSSVQENAVMTLTLFGAYIEGSFKPLGVYQTDDFLCMNLTLDNVTLEPNDELQVVCRYELLFSEGSTFELTFLYETNHLGIKVKTLDGYKAEGLGDLDLIYDAGTGMYITDRDATFGIYRGKTISIEVSEKPSGDNDSDTLFILLVIALLSTIVVGFIWYQRTKGSRSQDDDGGDDDEAKKKRGRPRGKGTVGPSRSSQLKKLLREKETILQAIIKLEADHKAGEIDDEAFEEMRSAYKKKAKGILKKIDKMTN